MAAAPRPDLAPLRVASLFSVAGRVALVTGGARGIGLMLASALVANGARVYVSSRDAAACASAASALTAAGPGTCVALPADLGTEAGCAALAAALARAEPALHVLVHNSGVAWGEPLDSYSVPRGWDRVLALNVVAPFSLTRALLPLLDAGSAPGHPSRVVMVGSVAGMRPQAAPTWGYDASKAALHHLALKLASDLADRRKEGGDAITVNVIAPGFVPTKMSAGLLVGKGKDAGRVEDGVPLRRLGGASDMAGALLYLASPAGAWVTGVVIPVDGGFLAKL